MARDFRNGITLKTVAEDRRKPEVIHPGGPPAPRLTFMGLPETCRRAEILIRADPCATANQANCSCPVCRSPTNLFWVRRSAIFYSKSEPRRSDHSDRLQPARSSHRVGRRSSGRASTPNCPHVAIAVADCSHAVPKDKHRGHCGQRESLLAGRPL
jgi:hypothetical protein